MSKVTNVIEGRMDATNLKVGIVCARFNSIFVEQLLSGAEDALLRHGAKAEDIPAMVAHRAKKPNGFPFGGLAPIHEDDMAAILRLAAG